jgi:hypothetical protein
MVEDILNSTKVEEPVKKEIIIEFDKERSDYADMLKGILSICNQSDAADFNKKVHINRYDEIKVRDNKSSISENIYEIVIGLPDKMDWCEEVNSYHGLHFCMMGKTAHIFVEETHTDKNDIIKFLKYETVVNDDFAKLKSKRSSGGMSGSSISLWNPSADVRSFKEQLNEEAFDKYLDVPRLFKLAGKKIGSIFKTVFRSMGFGRQNEIQKKKYEILIKDFYIHYMPMLIGELDAK